MIPNGRRWLPLGFVSRVGGPLSRQIAFLKAVIRPLPRCDYDIDPQQGKSLIRLGDGTEELVPTSILSPERRPDQEKEAARIRIDELETEMHATQLRLSKGVSVGKPNQIRINGGPMKNGYYYRPAPPRQATRR